MSDGGRVNANVRFQISPQEIRGETPARARLNSIQVGGLNHGQVRQQNVPLPPALVAPAIVAPAATKTHGMIVDDQTTLDQITNHFSGQSAGKTLRLHVHQDGTKELHLHNDNKKSNALGGRFAKLAGKAGFNVLGRATPEQKHQAAANYIASVVDRGTNLKGAGGAIFKQNGVSQAAVQVGDLGTLRAAFRADARMMDDRQHNIAYMKNAAKLDSDWKAWNAGGGDQSINTLKQNRTAAEGRLLVNDRAGEVARFQDGSIHTDVNTRFKMSEVGGGGVVFATGTDQTGQKTGLALKIEHPTMLATADYVSKLGDAVASRVPKPLPFDFPKHELVNLPQGSPERAVLERELGAIVAAGGDRAGKAQAQLDSLQQHGQLSKYELLEGTQLNQLPFEEKATLFKSGLLAADLGASTVLMPAFGLSDHLSPGGVDGAANLANLFMGDDGRLKMIDFDTKSPDGGATKGYDDTQVKHATVDLLSFLQHAADPGGDPVALLDAEIAHAKRPAGEPEGHPFAKVLNAALSPANTATGALFSSDGEQATFRSVISQEDSRSFVAMLMNSAISGLEYLRDNADAFAAGHEANQPTSAIKDPKGTFADIRQTLIDADLPALREAFRAKFESVVQ